MRSQVTHQSAYTRSGGMVTLHKTHAVLLNYNTNNVFTKTRQQSYWNCSCKPNKYLDGCNKGQNLQPVKRISNIYHKLPIGGMAKLRNTHAVLLNYNTSKIYLPKQEGNLTNIGTVLAEF